MGFRRSPKYSFHRPITSSVEVNKVPSLLYTAWMNPRFPLLRCWTVFQKRFGVNPFSMALLNSSHTHCFASATAVAAAFRVHQYPRTASGVPLKDSVFSWTASLTTSVHHGVRGLPPLKAPKTLWPQDTATASTMEDLNIDHSGSISLASTG